MKNRFSLVLRLIIFIWLNISETYDLNLNNFAIVSTSVVREFKDLNEIK